MTYLDIKTRAPFLVDDSQTLIPLPEPEKEFTSETYSETLEIVETVLGNLFLNAEDALSASESALSISATALDSVVESARGLASQIEALEIQTDRLASQSIPMTGGGYTHLITESFRDVGIRENLSEFSHQILQFSESGGIKGCPARPGLEIDSLRQKARLRQEGEAVAFSGIPGSPSALGGRIDIDRIYGTPVEKKDSLETGGWSLSGGSRSPLFRSFSDTPVPSWLPKTYQSGNAVRLRVHLDNPFPLTELKLRGLPSSPGTQLLETIAVVNSSLESLDSPAQTPTRTLNTNGNFFGGASSWTVLGSVQTIAAPGRGGSERSLSVSGQVYQKVNISSDSVFVLKYKAFCPFQTGGVWPGLTQMPIPAAPESTFVKIYFYSSTTPSFGYDSPLGVETFRHSYPQQGGLFAGVGVFTEILRAPTGTQSCVLSFGLDPSIAARNLPSERGVAIGYADVWLTDEAIVRSTQLEIPAPATSGLLGPSIPGGVRGVLSDNTVDSLVTSVGNESGSFVITDVWVTIAQPAPRIEPVDSWTLAYEIPQSDSSDEPYALSLPVENVSGDEAKDPLLLHQARYSGYGAGEYDNPTKLQGTTALPETVSSAPLYALNGLWASLLSRAGRFSPSPNRSLSGSKLGGYWSQTEEAQKTPESSKIAYYASQRWPLLWSKAVDLSQRQGRPLARLAALIALALPAVESKETGSLYIYTCGLASLTLLRREFAPSGVFVTQPLSQIDSGAAISGEIRELSVVTDPPLPTFGERLRLWVIPDAPDNESVSSMLKRAIPLDSTSPRASFHSASETTPGVRPATSDVAKILGQSDPAFYLTPSLTTEILFPNPDQGGYLALEHTPYVNQETIRGIVSKVRFGTGISPRSYDPNARRPILDLLTPDTGGHDFAASSDVSIPLFFSDSTGLRIPQPGVTGWVVTGTIKGLDGSTIDGYVSGLEIVPDSNNNLTASFHTPPYLGFYEVDATLLLNSLSYHIDSVFSITDGSLNFNYEAVQGYVPVESTLKFEDGRIALPDRRGKPRPGEAFYEKSEILTESSDISVYDQPASTASYAYKDSGTPTVSKSQTVIKRSFNTAHTPIVSGPNGAALKLSWHQSQEFDPLCGGILTRADVPIAASDYSVNVKTGQVTIFRNPPHNYSAYDQIIADYWWEVGDLAPREWFPDPGLDALYNIGATVPGTTPSQVQIGSDNTGELLANSQLLNGSSYWTLNGGNGVHFDNYRAGGLPSGRHAVTMCKDKANMTQRIPYSGPGDYNLGFWLGSNSNGSGPGMVAYEMFAKVRVINSSGTIIESQTLRLHVPLGNLTGSAAMKGSSSGSWNHTSLPPSWYIALFDSTISTDVIQTGWDAYKTTITTGQQIYSYWPQYAAVLNPVTGIGLVVPGDSNTPPGDVDNGTTFAVVPGTSVETPSFVVLPFQTPQGTGLLMEISLERISGDAHHGEDNISVAQVDVTKSTPRFEYVCPSGYTYDASQGVCVFNRSSDSGKIPSTLAELLKNPIQQSYPATRNVTPYTDDVTPTFRKANLDPESPDYYPVFEYRIDSGHNVIWADDLSSFGPYGQAQMVFQFETLRSDPRIILEFLPDGQTLFTPPGTPSQISLRSQVNSPELSSLQILINARL